jgi:transposase
MPTYEEVVQENSELRRRLFEQEERFSEQERRLVEQQRQIEKLERLLEELRRRGKRQAAPFSKGEPKSAPKRPGRKPGPEYGLRASRPRPERADEMIEVACPLFCGSCKGKVRLVGKESQFQIDLPNIRPQTTEFILHYGECRACGRRVIGRHARQTSQAMGVAGVQIGPGVVSLATYLNKTGGLSYGKIGALLEQLMGLRVARSTLCRALKRTATKARPIYDELIAAMQTSPVVYPDESGWRIGGHSAWLWAFTNRSETVYSIQSGRGFAEAASILGPDYPGVLVADGWAPYRRFTAATHQTCLAHLLRRCSEMLETAQGGAVRFPRQVQDILCAALAVRDRREEATISPHGVQISKGHLAARMDRLLAGRFTHAGNLRLAKHLRRNQKALFVFLERDDLEATNWPAEHAIRPAVVNRKSCGGNRTSCGAETQAVLMSLLRTCQQRNVNPLSTFTTILRSPKPPSYGLLLKPH